MSTSPVAALIFRRGGITPSSINVERRTVDVIFSTGARVYRGGYEPHHEELSLDPRHVRLRRFTNGDAPVLAAHNGQDLAAVIGVIETATIEPHQGIARVRFAKDDPIADSVWNKIAQGILRNVSVGYLVHKYDDRAPAADGVPIRRAIDWEPYELSVVPMAADPGAHVRSTTLHEERAAMDPETETETLPPSPAAEERTRATDILNIVRTARLEPTLAEELIRTGVTLETARGRVLERMIAQSEGGPRPGPAGVGFSDGLASDFRAAATDGLLLRAGIPITKPHAAARDFRATSIHEVARQCLSRAGIQHGAMSAETLISRAMSTSDFPLILQDGLGKAVRNGYELEPASHREWVRAVPVRDFKDQLRPILGSAPSLLAVLEAGEYLEGPMSEDSTSYRIAKYGRIVALTWETLVNDDLNAFLRVQPALGQAARRLEADTVYALLALASATGPVMQDGIVLFHASHGNIVGSAAFDAAQLGLGRSLLRKQTAVGGGFLSLVPRFLVVPSEKETAAEQLLATATRQTVAGPTAVTPEWIARLQLVVEPRLASTAVYLFADPAQIDTCELGLLEENMAGPTLVQETGFITDVFRTKVRHVFAPKFLDWRGAVKIVVT